MDSANSGSLQSSSGGDEEYDSRAADSVSAFMSGGRGGGGGGGGGGSISHAPPPFFDPLSGYLQQNPNLSLLNPNLSWPRTAAPPLRSDPNPIGHDGVHSVFPASNSYMPCFQPGAADGGASQLNQSQAAAAARNPKKRSRASRRAPTTVLTTDTTNFRAMVQEFTGIPAPPFNSSSSFPRSRLDFFSSRSAAVDAAQPPPYLRRPFAQKVQPPHPFLSSSSSLLTSAALDALASSSATAAATAAAASPSMNYQMQMTQNPNLFNIQSHNQNLLSSLLQSNPKFPFSTASIAAAKPQNSYEIPHNENHFTHQPSQTLAALIPSDHNGGGDVTNAALRSVNGGGYDFSAMDGKMSFSASSTSGFQGKSPENNAAAAVRGEGMVESWICSSE